VAREYRIQAALCGTAVPVPEVEVLCQDSRVIGAPFYVMRWVAGVVIDSPQQVQTCLPEPAARRHMAQEVVRTLADIHRVNLDAAGLANLGLHDDFVARQTEKMRRLWEKIRTSDLRIIDDVYARLVRHRPPQRYTGLVHNDFRIGNLILSAEGRVNAVLDWELAAIGDILVDIGALANNWDGPEDSGLDVWMRPAPTRAGGFPPRDELVSSYSRLSGFDVSDLNYYRALSYWRIAIIGAGMKRRYESGEMADRVSSIDVIARRIRSRAELADSFLPT
jgi:aminoglycoside phosphotransferase (APT) family kinase protein